MTNTVSLFSRIKPLNGPAVARGFAHALASKSTFPTGAPTGAATGSLSGPNSRRFEHIVVECPALPESITEAEVNPRVTVGSGVKADDVMAVLDTDKVSVDVVAPVGGRVIECKIQEHDVVEIGQGLFVIDTDLEGDDLASAGASAESEAAGRSTGGSTGREEKRTPMSRMRQKIGERLKEAQTTGVCLTTFQEVDMSAVMSLRKKLQPEVQKEHSVKLGFMSFFLAACTKALQEFPAINNYVEGKEVLSRNYVDISVAVATPTGLVVPVIKDCEKKSLVELEKSVFDLASRARDGKITMEEMSGGTFTISNGGAFGSLFGTPVINPPQTAILGMHGIQNRPVARDGQVVIRPMMYLALTYDHRLADGREAVLFLKKVQQLLESPQELLQLVPLA